MTTPSAAGAARPYQFFMLVLCVYALAALAFQMSVPADSETARLLAAADWIVCAIFFVDFLVCLWRAEDRWRYFYTWGWIDLLSSIPVLDAARWGRVARVTRLLRILRGIRATRYLLTAFSTHRTESALVGASLWVLMLLIAGSLAILHIETGVADANIATAGDALWWSVTTITTVGYGDRYPVTTAGRVVAGVLMTGGVGLFGLMSGLLAAWFVSPRIQEGEGPERAGTPAADGETVAALREEIRLLRLALEQRTGPPL